MPQFLLRNFAFNDRAQLYAFDKRTDREFVVSVRDAAAQNGFYEFQLDEETVSIEDALAGLETSASRVIAEIIFTDSLSNLSDEDRVSLALFVCVQLSRSLNWRLMQMDLNAKLFDHALRIAEASGGASPEQILAGSANDAVALTSIASAHKLLPYILEKPWVLQRVYGENRLQISDSPLTLHNMNEFGPYGNLGFAVPGIEVQLPLSCTLNLWIICPTIYAKFEEGYDTALDLKWRHGESSPVIDRTIRLVECIREGNPTELSEENVMHFNSLQVAFSARFVYSHDGDFSLVKRMISDNEAYRGGIRFKT